jgi:hypothetical protein
MDVDGYGLEQCKIKKGFYLQWVKAFFLKR